MNVGAMWRIVIRVGVCVALAGVGLAAVRGGAYVLELREPRVDLSRRGPATHPATAPTADGNRRRQRGGISSWP